MRWGDGGWGPQRRCIRVRAECPAVNMVPIGVTIVMRGMTVRVPISAAFLFLRGALLRGVVGDAEARIQTGRHRLRDVGVQILLVIFCRTGHVLFLVE